MSVPDVFTAHKEALQSHYTHVATYTNLILGAGYAGFFATWSLTKANLSGRLSSCAGILILVSLTFFVLFEIIKMVYTTIELEKQSRVLSKPEQYLELMSAFKATQSRMAYQLRFLWYVFFSVSFGTALCAAAILMYAFAKQLAAGT